jgi:hypothetical protein
MPNYNFTKPAKLAIYKRDAHKCIIAGCRDRFGLAIAHVFVARSKGGLGVEENGVLLCQRHHHMLDNGLDREHEQVKEYVENYLRLHYGVEDIDAMTYSKWKGFAIE